MGDQLTCKNLRGAKKWAAGETSHVNELQWVCEVPGEHDTMGVTYFGDHSLHT